MSDEQPVPVGPVACKGWLDQCPECGQEHKGLSARRFRDKENPKGWGYYSICPATGKLIVVSTEWS